MSFYWLGTRAREGICLSNWFPIKKGFILEDAQAPFPCHSVERTIGEKRNWGCDDLTHPVLADLFSKHAEKKGYPVLTYRPARPQDPHYNQAVWKISYDLDELFSNKWRTRKWLSECGLPVVPFQKIKGEQDFPYNMKKMGVLQALHGSAGKSSYIGFIDRLKSCYNSQGLKEALVAPYVTGPVINVHAAIYPNYSYDIGQPSVQKVTYCEYMDIYKPIYNGNSFSDYHLFFSETEKNYIKDVTKKIVLNAKKIGYIGVMGIDFKYSLKDKRIYVMEVNARLQGSSKKHIRLEKKHMVNKVISNFYYKII